MYNILTEGTKIHTLQSALYSFWSRFTHAFSAMSKLQNARKLQDDTSSFTYSLQVNMWDFELKYKKFEGEKIKTGVGIWYLKTWPTKIKSISISAEI